MDLIAFWIVALGYPAASLTATVAGPPGLRSAAAGILIVSVVSTLMGMVPASQRPGNEFLDVCSSFVLASWILFVSLRCPTLWSGALLMLQAIELALSALSLGPDAQQLLVQTPFERALFLVSAAIIGLLFTATISEVVRRRLVPEEGSLRHGNGLLAGSFSRDAV